MEDADATGHAVGEREPRLPPRPAVPSTLWCLVVALAVEHLVLSASLAWDQWTSQYVAVGAVMLLVVGLVLMIVLRRCEVEVGTLPSLVLVALLASGAAAWRGGVQHVSLDLLSSHAVSNWDFRAEGDATPTEFGYRCRAKARLSGPHTGAAEVWLSLKEPLLRGEHLRCVGRFRPPADDEFGRAGWCQGICGSVTVVRLTRREGARGLLGVLCALRAAVLNTIDPSRSAVRALMAGCVCGYRRALDEQGLVDAFSRCGIAHLIAVSGAHLALVCSLMAKAVGAFDLVPAMRLPLLAVTSGLFVAFCGAPVSAVRAWAMSLVAFGSQLAGRRAHALSSVGLVGLLMALADPNASCQLGFLLSAVSVASLALFSSYANYLLQVLLPSLRLPRWMGARMRRTLVKGVDALRATLAATMVCQLATLPIVTVTFGRLSLVAPLSNVVLGVPVTLITVWGLVCALTGSLIGAEPLLWVADRGEVPLVEALDWLGGLPYASVTPTVPASVLTIAVAAGAAGLLVAWPRVDRRVVGKCIAIALVLAGALVTRWWLLAPPRIVVLDVGQGDAILVQDGIHAVLVDTGPDDAVTAALARNHVLGLDAVVITHLHDDHYGGLDDLVGVVPCSAVVVARGMAAAMDEDLQDSCQRLSGAPACEMGYHDVLRVGRFALRMVWPTVPVDGDENSESIELAVSYENDPMRMDALLTGDAERDETRACVLAGDVGDIDILKVGHHGSEVSLDTETLAVLRPEVAVASAGEGNSYGHPRPECVSLLKGAGARFLCTIESGDVDLRPSARGIEVRCARR